MLIFKYGISIGIFSFSLLTTLVVLLKKTVSLLILLASNPVVVQVIGLLAQQLVQNLVT